MSRGPHAGNGDRLMSLTAGMPTAAIQAQTDKILATPAFLRSQRLSRFLRYAVEEALQGRADQLKEYSIGVAAFDRGSSFDPRMESIVRVEAAKLRARLREYYETQGRDDPFVIEFPTGTYVPVFRQREQPASKSLPGRGLIVAAVVGLAVVAIAILAAWRRSLGSEGFDQPPLAQVTFDLGITDYPALSPDGKLLAYASDRGGAGDFDIWVQRLAGGEPVRLTRHPADDTAPAFSPDGSQIAFRSERDGGGIYVIASSGGDEALLVRDGRTPRFSPDGKWIAYWVGQYQPDLVSSDTGRIYIIGSTGGPARQIRPDFATAQHPLWSPDGKHLLFRGSPSRTEPPDWHVTSIDGGPAVKTGASAWFRRHELFAWHSEFWSERDDILFSASSGVSANLWQVRLSPRTWQLEGAPRRLTFGTAWDGNASIAAGSGGVSRLVFSSLTINANVWMLPLDANHGKVTGPLRQLTAYASWGATQPCVSDDARQVVFTSTRKADDADISLKRLESGAETVLVRTPSGEHSPHISADGSTVVYTADEERRRAVYRVNPGRGAPEWICEQCYGWDISPDGSRVVLSDLRQSPRPIVLLNVASRTKTTLLRHSESDIYEPHLSPDERWIAFRTGVEVDRSRLFIAPVREGTATPPADWIPITGGRSWDERPRWSPDGKLLYFASHRDGFACIWAQSLMPATKRPAGPAIPVYHSHTARRSLGNLIDDFEISVARDKLVFGMGDSSGNIWMTRLEAHE